MDLKYVVELLIPTSTEEKYFITALNSVSDVSDYRTLTYNLMEESVTSYAEASTLAKAAWTWGLSWKTKIEKFINRNSDEYVQLEHVDEEAFWNFVKKKFWRTSANSKHILAIQESRIMALYYKNSKSVKIRVEHIADKVAILNTIFKEDAE